MDINLIKDENELLVIEAANKSDTLKNKYEIMIANIKDNFSIRISSFHS